MVSPPPEGAIEAAKKAIAADQSGKPRAACEEYVRAAALLIGSGRPEFNERALSYLDLAVKHAPEAAQGVDAARRALLEEKGGGLSGARAEFLRAAELLLDSGRADCCLNPSPPRRTPISRSARAPPRLRVGGAADPHALPPHHVLARRAERARPPALGPSAVRT